MKNTSPKGLLLGLLNSFLRCVRPLCTAESVSALQSFTFVSQLWAAAAASALQSFVSHLWTSQALVSILKTQTVWGLRWCNLSPTSFHLSPTSFHLSPNSFHLSPRLGACGFVFHFFSFVSQAGCLWSGSRLACLPLPVICFPLLFICLPRPFICLPVLFICLPVLFICLPGWVLVVGFPAGLSPASFHVFPTSFHLSPTSFHLSPTSFHLSPSSFHLSPRLAPICAFVPHFFSLVSQAGWLWSGSQLACLPLPFICLPLFFDLSPSFFNCLPGWVLVVPAGLPLPLGWVLVVGFPAGLSPTSFYLFPTSFHLSPRLGACGRVPGWLVSHFLAFVSNFCPKQFTVRGSQFFLKMCHCWCPPISTGHVAFLIYHFSPRSTAGVRPFPLAMQHVYSFVSRVCHWCCRPFPLAM